MSSYGTNTIGMFVAELPAVRTGGQAVPRKRGFTPLRLYGALEPWFDTTWRPGEIQLTNEAAFARLTNIRCRRAAGGLRETGERPEARIG
jgi:hypothetical protein